MECIYKMTNDNNETDLAFRGVRKRIVVDNKLRLRDHGFTNKCTTISHLPKQGLFGSDTVGLFGLGNFTLIVLGC